jgi:parvulin-like peptidyl-prolyl isomerase
MEKMKCPHCGCPVGNEATVCGECGKEWSDSEQAPVQEEKRGNNKIYGILAILLVVVAGAALVLFTGLVPNPFRDGSIAAVVNGEKISSQELDQKLELYKKVYGQGGRTDFSSPAGKAALANMKNQVLNTMIQEKVLLTEAAKEKITVSKEEIAEKIASIKKTMNLSDKDFEEFLKNHAINLTNFEKRMEKEVLIAKLITKGTQEKGLSKEAWFKELNARAKVEVFAK